jgi:hypothetical protein
VALPRRLAGRSHDRVRPSGRPLHGSLRGRGSPRAHVRPRLGLAAALLARRPHHRLHLGPRRDRQRLAHGRGREERPRAHAGEGLLRPHPRLDAGRLVRRGPQGGREEGGAAASGALALPPRGRGRHQAHELRRAEQRLGRRPLEGRPVDLPLDTQGPVQLHPRPHAGPLADLPLRPDDGRDLSGHRGLRGRGPPAALAGRKDAGLREAARQRHGPRAPRPRDRRRARRGHRPPARRAGGLRTARSVAGLRVHARRQEHGLLDRRQDPAARRREPTPDGDPLPREGRAVARSPRRLAGQARQRARQSTHPPLGERVSRRRSDRLRRLRPHLRPGAQGR